MKNKVKELRKQKNLTQDELAKALGVSRQTINAIENDKYFVYPYVAYFLRCKNTTIISQILLLSENVLTLHRFLSK